MFDKETLSQLEANYTPRVEQKAAPKQKTKGRGGFLTSLISEGGAAGGALAGGAAGTAILPGIGTFIGAGLGGLLGGFGGSAAEQKVRDDEVDWKKAAGEGLLSGATGAIVPGGAGTLVKSGLKRGAQEATEQAAKQYTRPSLLSKFSSSATKSGSGIKVGGNVGDVNRVDQAVDVIQKYGISGTPTKQLRRVDETMGQLGKQVDDVLAKNPIQLDGTTVRTQVQQAIDDPLKYAELDLTTPGAQRALTAHLDKFTGAKTAKEVNDYIKTLNPVAKRAQDKLARGATITDKEAAALAAKRSGDEVLSQFPEIKPLKTDMAVLFERNPEIAKLSEQKAGIPILGIQSRSAKQAIAGAQSKAGQLASGASQKPSTLMGQFKKAGAAQLAASGVSNIGEQTQAPADVQDASALLQVPEAQPEMEQPSQEAYSQANMLADIQRDPKNADTYMGLYKMLAPETQAAQKPLSAESSKVIATANSGLSSLQQLGDIIQQGGVPTGTVVPGRGLLGGLGQNLLGTSSYDAAADNVADAMVRARTGAAATKDELALYRRLLPQAADPPEVQQQKLQTVYDYFTSISNRTGAPGTDQQVALGV